MPHRNHSKRDFYRRGLFLPIFVRIFNTSCIQRKHRCSCTAYVSESAAVAVVVAAAAVAVAAPFQTEPCRHLHSPVRLRQRTLSNRDPSSEPAGPPPLAPLDLRKVASQCDHDKFGNRKNFRLRRVSGIPPEAEVAQGCRRLYVALL